jgi:acetyl esterase/lipase
VGKFSHRDGARCYAGHVEAARSACAIRIELEDCVIESLVGRGCRERPRIAGTIYVSPLSGEPSGLPPTLILVASDEVLRDDAVRMADKMRIAGCAVEIEVCCAHYAGSPSCNRTHRKVHARQLVTAIPLMKGANGRFRAAMYALRATDMAWCCSRKSTAEARPSNFWAY